MKNTQAFARIVLVGLGIYTCLRLIPLLLSSVIVLLRPSVLTLSVGLLHLLLIVALMAMVAYILFYKSNALALRLTQDLDPIPETPVNSWLPAALRLICMGTGLLYLSSFITGLSHACRLWLQLQRHPGALENRIPTMTVDLIAWTLLLPLGIYLICGAPHFVRWQIKNITRQTES